MREIKFRAWCISMKRMLDYEHLYNATKGMVDIANADIIKRKIPINKPAPYGLFLPLEDKDLIFMQYTGHKDCTLQEIYEGDVICLAEDFQETGVICWDEDSANFYIKFDDNEYCTFDDFYGYDLVVLGNIYDEDNVKLKGGD